VASPDERDHIIIVNVVVYGIDNATFIVRMPVSKVENRVFSRHDTIPDTQLFREIRPDCHIVKSLHDTVQ
jgi:hypothetical protein